MAFGIGRAYSVNFTAVAIAAQQDIFYVKPAADKPVYFEALYLSNVGGTADAGDAQEELLDLRIVYVPATVTASSGGNSFTALPLAVNDSAAGFTSRINDTTIATTTGSLKVLHADGWNIRVPYVWLPPPEHRPTVANAAAMVVRLQTGPADSVTCSGTLVVREVT